VRDSSRFEKCGGNLWGKAQRLPRTRVAAFEKTSASCEHPSHKCDRTVLSIHDNGFGLREGGTKAGLGLESMRYRASSLGGTLRITNPSTGGTRVRCVWSMVPSSAQRARAAVLFKP